MSAPVTDSTPTYRDRTLAYLQLFRLPNVFTAAADVMMGYLFVQRGLDPLPVFLCLLGASCLLYTSGIVLNDVFDIDIDRQERPKRPLPSGRISPLRARRIGFALLACGWLLAVLASLLANQDGSWLEWRPAAVASLLVVAIVSYDAGIKETPLGPLLMGLCRALNVLLGMSTGGGAGTWLGGWGPHQWCVAGGIGVHIAGVTWFGRGEAGVSRRGPMLFGLLVMAAGWWLLASFPVYAPPGFELQLRSVELWYLLLALLAIPVLRNCAVAVVSPGPTPVQQAVRQGIWTLIWLDAAVTVAVVSVPWALVIVCLFVPMFLLGRWVYST
jgi:4-hydroxybenzoate polyprenyltransferase